MDRQIQKLNQMTDAEWEEVLNLDYLDNFPRTSRNMSSTNAAMESQIIDSSNTVMDVNLWLSINTQVRPTSSRPMRDSVQQSKIVEAMITQDNDSISQWNPEFLLSGDHGDYQRNSKNPMECETNYSSGIMSANSDIGSSSRGYTSQWERNSGVKTQQTLTPVLPTPLPSTSRGSTSQWERNSAVSTQQIQTPVLPTPLPELSLYSLMQKSAMRDYLQSNTVEPMITQQNDSLSQWDPVFSLSGDQEEYQTNPKNPLETVINDSSGRMTASSNIRSTSLDGLLNVNFSQHHQQSAQIDETQGFLTCESLFGSYQLPSTIIGNVNSIPKAITNLYAQIKSAGYSDWSFVHALSAQTCQEYLPMSSNVFLKKSLLLSIASIDTVSLRLWFNTCSRSYEKVDVAC